MKGTVHEPHKSSIGNLDANLMAMLTCLITIILLFVTGWFAWIFPLIIMLIEKESPLVKFVAKQSLALTIVVAIVAIILDIILWSIFASSFWYAPFAFAPGAIIITVIRYIIFVILALLELMVLLNAWKNTEYEISFLKPLAAKFK